MSIVSDPLAVAAQALADAFYALDREWNATMEQIEDPDESEALNRALCDSYPFGRSVEDLSAEVGEWAQTVADLMANRPTVIDLAVKEIGDDLDALTADLASGEAETPPNEAYRNWQNGGLGGEVGRVGGIFTPTVLKQLQTVLLAINTGHPGQVHSAAEQFAREFRVARGVSRS